ncbi:hypothetical protein [Streptomyces violascens]|uniref:Uncharacterized protein n=1 Tax=Streptomyces violascens TaxID=67381 RepID=A0ABQ3QRL8_9ACTN|nr:hypothetical protein [Streptomyces violascens]GGU48328.1 hypothetical protein GCM10010289_81060 [Streptomyces violascens]GHI39918.1 hypothetical protein Sviol_43260 [Streptomyces violascens]
MKPTRAEELYFDPEMDLFMLTEHELARRALALAGACCRRATETLDIPDGSAVRTALRAVALAVRLGHRADIAEAHEQAARQAEFCFCPWRIP